MVDSLGTLCCLNGTSGSEKAVRDYIIAQIAPYCETRIDALGNLFAYKKGSERPKHKIMCAAHMDEVGFIVTYINADGTLKIAPVGGINASAVIGRQVTINGLVGVVGAKAVHHLSADEKKKAPDFDDLSVDIGAADKSDAEKYVRLGDCAYFRSEFLHFGSGKIKGKAIDDRLGCMIMIQLIQGELKYDTTFAFTVQEEIGTRGAKTAAFAEAPDFAVVLESTTAADIPPAEDDKRVCTHKGGAVVSFMDRSTIYDKELYELAFKIGKEENIPVQTKTMVAGGNDSGAIHISGKGVRTCAISAPCRYLHTASCVIDEADADACKKLAKSLIERIGALD